MISKNSEGERIEPHLTPRYREKVQEIPNTLNFCSPYTSYAKGAMFLN